MIDFGSIKDLGVTVDILESFFLERGQRASDYILKNGDSLVGKKLISKELMIEIKKFNDNFKREDSASILPSSPSDQG